MTQRKSDYPTHDQMKEAWDAWKEKGRAGIREILEDRLRKHEEQKKITPAPPNDSQ